MKNNKAKVGKRERLKCIHTFPIIILFAKTLTNFPIWNTKCNEGRSSDELNVSWSGLKNWSLSLCRLKNWSLSQSKAQKLIHGPTHTHTHTHTLSLSLSHTHKHTHTHEHESSRYIDIVPEVSFVSQNMSEFLVPLLEPLPEHVSGLVQHGARHVLLSGVVADGGLHHPLHLFRRRFSWRHR